MLKKLKTQLIIMAATASMVSLTAHASATQKEEQKKETPSISFKSTALAQGVYMLEGVGGFAGGNMMVTVGDQGVVMVDNSMSPFLDTLKETLGQLTNKPVDFLINTHVHGDHTGNNAAMGAAHTHIIGHQNLRTQMLEKGVPGADGPVKASSAILPMLTYTDQMGLHLNQRDMQLVHVPNAHTDGDSVIYLPVQNIIHAGDVFFNGLYPYIDLASGGSAKGYLAGQKAIYAMANDSTKIVPGHGPLATRADLKKAIVMLEAGIQQVQAMIDKGLTEDAVVAKNPLAKYHDTWNWSFITTEKMTRTLYKSLKGDVGIAAAEHSH
ncbi:MBL fold metallo-hydrolase [Marinagarivorans algicola]|uniref:MBL fold metallo-hydrolase n=1 Tax=Marinagarivorans algicola TaxID=1513270 RepID=UPI0006B65D49|nr:MBL fold metallo-hydrolase [Marinagarivorans algicola]